MEGRLSALVVEVDEHGDQLRCCEYQKSFSEAGAVVHSQGTCGGQVSEMVVESCLRAEVHEAGHNDSYSQPEDDLVDGMGSQVHSGNTNYEQYGDCHNLPNYHDSWVPLPPPVMHEIQVQTHQESGRSYHSGTGITILA
jgi:hypothetical protein